MSYFHREVTLLCENSIVFFPTGTRTTKCVKVLFEVPLCCHIWDKTSLFGMLLFWSLLSHVRRVSAWRMSSATNKRSGGCGLFFSASGLILRSAWIIPASEGLRRHVSVDTGKINVWLIYPPAFGVLVRNSEMLKTRFTETPRRTSSCFGRIAAKTAAKRWAVIYRTIFILFYFIFLFFIFYF